MCRRGVLKDSVDMSVPQSEQSCPWKSSGVSKRNRPGESLVSKLCDAIPYHTSNDYESRQLMDARVKAAAHDEQAKPLGSDGWATIHIDGYGVSMTDATLVFLNGWKTVTRRHVQLVSRLCAP